MTLFLARSLALCALAGAAAAQGTPELRIYGRLDLSLDRVQSGTKAGAWQVVDDTSRLGFEGGEALGGSLRAIYGIEFGINADSGTSTSPMLRHSYVGLTGVFGAVAVGHLDAEQASGAPIYSQLLRNLDFVAHDGGAAGITTAFQNARNRVNNAIGYASPIVDGWSLRARHDWAGPDTPGPLGAGVVGEADFGQTDLGLNYERGPFAAGLAYAVDRKRGGLLANDFSHKWQAIGSYLFPGVKAWALAGRDQYQAGPGARAQVDYWLAGCTVPLAGQAQITSNVMRRAVQADPGAMARNIQSGYIVLLSKRTRLFLLVDRLEASDRLPGSVTRTVSGGMQQRF